MENTVYSNERNMPKIKMDKRGEFIIQSSKAICLANDLSLSREIVPSIVGSSFQSNDWAFELARADFIEYY